MASLLLPLRSTLYHFKTFLSVCVLAGASSHCVDKSFRAATSYIELSRGRSGTQLSALCFVDHVPVCNFHLAMALISLKLQCYTLDDTPCHFEKRHVLKVSSSPIQGSRDTSILDSDSIKSRTHLLLTNNNTQFDPYIFSRLSESAHGSLMSYHVRQCTVSSWPRNSLS